MAIKLNHQLFSSGKTGNLTCLGFHPVTPRTTMTASQLRLHLRSARFNGEMMMPGMFDIMAFYVPHRLAWDEFPEWVAGTQDEAAPVLPTGNYTLFDHDGVGNDLLGRSMNRIYMDYYEHQAVSDFDITNTNMGNLNVRLPLGSEVPGMQYTEIDEETFEITVDPTSHEGTIVLSDLHRAMVNQRREVATERMGDTYGDYLQAFGVKMGARVRTTAERLGGITKRMNARQSFDATTASATAMRFEEHLEFSLRKHYRFDEHGYVIIVAAFRPVMMNKRKRACLPALMNKPEQFYFPVGDVDLGFREQALNGWLLDASTDTGAVHPWQEYVGGGQMVNFDPQAVGAVHPFLETEPVDYVGLLKYRHSETTGAVQGNYTTGGTHPQSWSAQGYWSLGFNSPVPPLSEAVAK